MPAELTLPEDTRSDAAAVRTLAHPLRSRLFGALRRGGPGTATSLAAQLGTNSGATSYHLRKLAEVGLVVDAPGRTGRERHWEAASGNPSWKPSDFPDDEEAATALSWLERDYIRHFAEKAEEWLDHQDDWPAEWIDVLRMADSPALVDVTQMRRLRDELGELLAKYARIGQGNPQARRVAVYTYIYPIDLDRPPRTSRAGGPA